MEWLPEDLISSGRKFHKLEALRRKKLLDKDFLKVVFEHFDCDAKHTKQIP